MRNVVVGVIAALMLGVGCSNGIQAEECACVDEPETTACVRRCDAADAVTVCMRPDGSLCQHTVTRCEADLTPRCIGNDGTALSGTPVCAVLTEAESDALVGCE